MRPTRLLPLLATLLLAFTSLGQSARVAIEKRFSPNPAVAGADLTFTIEVSNEGPDDAANVEMLDALPSGVTFASLASPPGWACTTGATVDCTTPLLSPGIAAFVLVVHTDPTLASGAVLSNTATVTSTTNDPRTSDNTSTANVSFVRQATVSVTKSAPATIDAGATITYTIDYASSGPSETANATFTDSLPPGTTLSTISAPGWNCSGTTCTRATLAPGDSGTITITAAVDPSVAAGTQLTNSATITSDSSQPATGSATTTVTTQSVLGVSITDSPDPVFPASTLTYVVTATNAGPSAAADPTPTVTLSPLVTLVSITPPADWSCVGTTCTTPSMLPGASAQFTIVTQTAPTLTTGAPIVTTATFGTATATATTTATNASTVTAAKTFTTLAAEGTTVTYTVVVSNSGPQNQADNSGDELVDVLAPSLTLVSAAATAGTVTGAGNTVHWNGAIPAGGSTTITITATINPGTAGMTVTNQAAIHYDADGNGTNESSGTSNAVSFEVLPGAAIPTLSAWALALLATGLAVAGALAMRR